MKRMKKTPEGLCEFGWTDQFAVTCNVFLSPIERTPNQVYNRIDPRPVEQLNPYQIFSINDMLRNVCAQKREDW